MTLSLRFLQAQPDRRLVDLARQGHEAAFEAVVRRYRNELLRYCRRITPEAATAEDTLQQALLQAWKALRAGADVRDIRSWLYRIAHNVAISNLRAAGAMPQEIEDAPASFDVDQVVQQRLEARAALAEMASLPELQRQVLVSTTLDGASHEEVATALGLTNGSVRGLIYRARAALRAAAAAVIPTPALNWVVEHAETRARRPFVLVESALGGGGAGVAGLIAKGGAVIAITGAVAGGGMTVSGTTAHRPDTQLRQADRHLIHGPPIPAEGLADSASNGTPADGHRSAMKSASVSRGAGGIRSRPGDTDGSRSGPSGTSMNGRDGGSSDRRHSGSRHGSTGGSSGGSDGDSSLATITTSSGPGGSSGDSRLSSGSSSSAGGSSGGTGSDGGMTGTSGRQVTTAASNSGGMAGPTDGSWESSGSGDTTTGER